MLFLQILQLTIGYVNVVFRWNCAKQRLTVKTDSSLLVSAFEWEAISLELHGGLWSWRIDHDCRPDWSGTSERSTVLLSEGISGWFVCPLVLSFLKFFVHITWHLWFQKIETPVPCPYCKLSCQQKMTLVTRRMATLPTGRPLPEDSFNEIPHLLLPEVTVGFNYSVFLFLRRVVTKLSCEVGCGEVTNPK